MLQGKKFKKQRKENSTLQKTPRKYTLKAKRKTVHQTSPVSPNKRYHPNAQSYDSSEYVVSKTKLKPVQKFNAYPEKILSQKKMQNMDLRLDSAAPVAMKLFSPLDDETFL